MSKEKILCSFMNINCDKCGRPFQEGVSCCHPTRKGQTFDLCGNCCSYVAEPGKHPLNYGTPPSLRAYVQGQAARIQTLQAEVAALKASVAPNPPPPRTERFVQTQIPQGWAETKVPPAAASFATPPSGIFGTQPPASQGVQPFSFSGSGLQPPVGVATPPFVFSGSAPQGSGFGFSSQQSFSNAASNGQSQDDVHMMSGF